MFLISLLFIYQAEADRSNEYNDFEPASLNTTYQVAKDLRNIDMVIHIGDLSYANGYLSQWDQFTAQIEPIASTVPYMVGMYVNYRFSIICFVLFTLFGNGWVCRMKISCYIALCNIGGFHVVHSI